jgi:hypothetical protein
MAQATALILDSTEVSVPPRASLSKEDRTHGRRRRWAVFDPPRMIHLGHRWRNPDLRRAVLYLLGLLLAFTELC